MRGLLIAFEGLDQSGKQTQAERLKAAVEAVGRTAVLLDFPSYETQIGDVLALEASSRSTRTTRNTEDPESVASATYSAYSVAEIRL